MTAALLMIRVWRDPLRFLVHDVYTFTEFKSYQAVSGYKTGCGLVLSIGDVNETNLELAEPTMLIRLTPND